MEKVITKLKHLSRIMREVEKAELPFDMYAFYGGKEWHEVSDRTIHTCGTAACVIGYAVLDKDFLKSFDIPLQSLHPEYVWEILAREWGELELHESIFGQNHVNRKEDAQSIELFSKEELQSLGHLNSDEPTAKDAADYIDLLIEKIGER